MSNSREQRLEAFGKLLDVLDELRVKCPWDAKQTNESLRPNTVEEVMELSEALLGDDALTIKKELGDVLLHIIFYSKIADEQGRFDIADVCDALREKLIFRHPHVFGNVHVDGAAEVTQNWEQIKLKEKNGNKTEVEFLSTGGICLDFAKVLDDFSQNICRGIGNIDLAGVLSAIIVAFVDKSVPHTGESCQCRL